MSRDYLTAGKINKLNNEIEGAKKRYNAFKKLLKKEKRKTDGRNKIAIDKLSAKMREIKSEYKLNETMRFNLEEKMK